MGVAEHCKNTFLELQRKKAYRYVIFKIDMRRKKRLSLKRLDIQLKAMMISPLQSLRMTADMQFMTCRYAIYLLPHL